MLRMKATGNHNVLMSRSVVSIALPERSGIGPVKVTECGESASLSDVPPTSTWRASKPVGKPVLEDGAVRPGGGSGVGSGTRCMPVTPGDSPVAWSWAAGAGGRPSGL